MEVVKAEVEVIEQILNDENQDQVRELGDLQLALVGGGIGDVVFG